MKKEPVENEDGEVDLEQQAERLARRELQRGGQGLGPEVRDDCLAEARAAALLMRPNLGGKSPAERGAYAEVSIGRAVRRFLRTEQDCRRHTLSIEGLRTDDGEPIEWPGQANTEAEAISHLDFEERIDDDRLAAALKLLSPQQHEVMLMHFVEELSDQNAGSILGITANAVQKCRSAALLRLERLLSGPKTCQKKES